MNRIILFFLLLFTLPVFLANQPRHSDSLEYLLDLIDEKAVYMAIKERHINELETTLLTSSGEDSLRYQVQKRLYQAYATYKSDSAIFYANQNLELGMRHNAADWIKESKLTLASLYLTGGMYIDSYQLLSGIASHSLPNDLLIKYYDTWKQFYKFYAFNNPNRQLYLERSNAYRDSLLAQLDPLTNHYKIVYAEKLHDQQDLGEAKKLLMSMLDRSTDEDHERAVLAYALANVYQQEGNIEMQ